MDDFKFYEDNNENATEENVGENPSDDNSAQENIIQEPEDDSSNHNIVDTYEDTPTQDSPANENQINIEDKITYTNTTDTKNKKNISPWLASLIISLPLCVLTLFICFCLTALLTTHGGKKANFNETAREPRLGGANITVTPSDIDSEKAASALSCTVNIQGTDNFSGFFSQSFSSGNATGVIIREDGYILTSSYLIEGLRTVTVDLSDGTSYEAQVYNIDSANNAAILKIDASGLTPIPIGDSSLVKIGDPVSVIGNAITENLSNPITVGTVSGIDNNVKLQSGQSINLLQISAPTIAKSIGGLVLNKDGELIGIATAMISNPSSEIGLVTPINDLSQLLNNIVSIEGTSSGLMIGITGTDASYGVVIEGVNKNSPAEKAGIKVGDLVVKVDGETVSSVSNISDIKNRHQKGDTIVFTIYRDGEMQDINIILE